MYLGLPFPHNKFLARVSFEALSLEKAKICSSEKLCFFITLILKLVHCTAFVKIGGIAKFSGGKK